MTDFVKPTTVREVLLGAANLLEQKGHIQGNWTGSNGEICLAEALTQTALNHEAKGMANASDGPSDPLLKEAVHQITKDEPEADTWYAICRLNNKLGTTKESLIAQLRELAEAA